jgi:hypothetical protein
MFVEGKRLTKVLHMCIEGGERKAPRYETNRAHSVPEDAEFIPQKISSRFCAHSPNPNQLNININRESFLKSGTLSPASFIFA